MALLLNKKLLLMLLIMPCFVQENAAYYQGSSICGVSDKCKTSRLGDKVPNPMDSHRYFICIEDVDGKKVPSDASFKYQYYPSNDNSGKQVCFNICDGKCVNYHYERIADMNDCSIYYTCSPGNRKEISKCPSDAPYFDGVKCQNDISSCCSCCDECTAYCYKGNTQVADPYDCKSFYMCHNKGYPDPKSRYQCPEGKYFDKTKGVCGDDDKYCNSVCNVETSSTSVEDKSIPST